MTKTDIVKKLSTTNMESVKLTQTQSSEVLNAILDIIVEGLKEDGTVQLTGFGTLKCKTVAERVGHNPKNPSEKIVIPEHNQISFTSGQSLKESVNK